MWNVGMEIRLQFIANSSLCNCWFQDFALQLFLSDCQLIYVAFYFRVLFSDVPDSGYSIISYLKSLVNNLFIEYIIFVVQLNKFYFCIKEQ